MAIRTPVVRVGPGPPANMPDDTLHIDRFVFTEPRERPGRGWCYTARSPEDPTTYLGWLYPNPCQDTDLQRVLSAVETARALRSPRLLTLHAAGHKRPTIGPAGGYLYAVTEPVDPARSIEAGLLPRAPIPLRSLVAGLGQLVEAIAAMAAFPHSHGWLGPEHGYVREDGQLVLVNPWQGWVEDHLRQGLTTGTSDWQYTWVAPETVSDPSKIDVGSDLFTACAIAYKLATGREPFDSASALALDPALFELRVPDPRSLREDIPEGLARILQRGLAPNWNARYHHPEELLADLRSLGSGGLPATTAAGRSPSVAAPPAAPPPKAPAASAPSAAPSSTASSSRLRAGSDSRRDTERRGRSGRRSPRVGTDPLQARAARSRGEGAAPRSALLPVLAVLAVGAVVVVAALALMRDGGGPGPPATEPAIAPSPSPNPTADPAPRQDVSDPAPRRDTADPLPRSGPGSRRGAFAALDHDTEPVADLPPLPSPLLLEPDAVDPAALAPGLVVRSYIDTRRHLPDLSQRGPVGVAVVSAIDLAARPQNDWYVLRFEGWLRIDQPGIHRFELGSDDGSWLWLGETLIIDNGGMHSTEWVSGRADFTAGHHRLRVDFLQGDGDSHLELRWTRPDGSSGDLAERLFHRASTAPRMVDDAEAADGVEGTPLAQDEPGTDAPEMDEGALATVDDPPAAFPESPATDAESLAAARIAVVAVLAGRKPAAVPIGWASVLDDLATARAGLAGIAIDHAGELVRRRATILFDRSELELAGADPGGLSLVIGPRGGDVRVGWDRVPAVAVARMLRTVLFDLEAEQRKAVRLVLAAAGEIDPRLARHREALAAIHAEADEPEPTTREMNPVGRPGVVVSEDPGEIVLLPSDADATQAAPDFRLVAEPSAATGRAWQAALKRIKSTSTLVIGPETPCLIYRFEAPADRVYQVWLRGRAEASEEWEAQQHDAVQLVFATPIRFVGEVRQNTVAPDMLARAAEINGYGPPDGWFWSGGYSDDRWEESVDVHPVRVRFERGGQQELRVYLTEGPGLIDLIWLSATQDTRYQPNQVPPWIDLP